MGVSWCCEERKGPKMLGDKDNAESNIFADQNDLQSIIKTKETPSDFETFDDRSKKVYEIGNNAKVIFFNNIDLK